MDLKAYLEDQYKYYTKQRQGLDQTKEPYATGKCDGAIEVVSKIYMNEYGPMALYWMAEEALQE